MPEKNAPAKKGKKRQDIPHTRADRDKKKQE
jgi:hypothetical protein